MRLAKVKVRGKPREIYTPLTDGELENQLGEIFIAKHYKKGRKKDGVYLDLGANIGMTVWYFGDIAKKIYAFEPSRENFEALKLNTKGMDNVEIFKKAIINTEGKFPFFGNDSTPQTFFPELVGVKNKEIVECTTLEKFFEENNIEHIDTMKIDIEGSEYAVFVDETFEKVSKKIDTIIGEAHYVIAGFPEILPQVLGSYGYKTEFLKFKPPNLLRTLNYVDEETGKKKTYNVGFNTIFYATR